MKLSIFANTANLFKSRKFLKSPSLVKDQNQKTIIISKRDDKMSGEFKDLLIYLCMHSGKYMHPSSLPFEEKVLNLKSLKDQKERIKINMILFSINCLNYNKLIIIS